MSKKWFDKQYNNLVTQWDPDSSTAESYRILAANAQLFDTNQKIHTILVTSAGEKEGKSVTSANLAIVMAQSNKKTVFIDTNIRNPSGQYMFGLKNTKGLTSYLTTGATIDHIIQDTVIPNLFVITSGPITSNPFNDGKMNRLLQELKKRFDMVILDGSPILTAADSSILSTMVDGCIIVLNAKKSNRAKVIKANQQLEKVHANLLGIVLNQEA